ncbi:hypothetical protein GGS20DRAFT_553374 [Poronia punctata]|nr:hypothetical protein GGS20DRAFT_553374 [Poronia punctata]
MSISADELDRVHHFILAIYFIFFLSSHAQYIRRCAIIMADTLPAPTTPKKLFKASSKTKAPTPVKQPRTIPATDSQSPQQADQANTSNYELGNAESTEENDAPSAENISSSTNLAPLTDLSGTASKAVGDSVESDTTGDTPAGLVNTVLTPSETASQSTDARPSLSRDGSQNQEDTPSDSQKDSSGGLASGLIGAVTDKAKSAAGGQSERAPSARDALMDSLSRGTPSEIAHYFSERGNPEMGRFVRSLAGEDSSPTPKARRSPRDATPTPKGRPEKETGDERRDTRSPSGEPPRDDKSVAKPEEKPQPSNAPDPADVSKAAVGTFRDTGDNLPADSATNRAGEPDVSKISNTAAPAIPEHDKQTDISSPSTNEQGGQNEDHVTDNMGRPAHVERSIEIPLQRPKKNGNGPSQPEGRKSEGVNMLGDFEDMPNDGDLPDIPEDDSEDPPEQLLDPSVHSASASISPIPKIPKIEHIRSPPPEDLPRRAQGLEGYVVDDVGNIVDPSGTVLGHATGDLPEMIGRKVSEGGQIHGDGGEILGYVSENFANPPSPKGTPIPADLLGSLRVDPEGNILDSNGHIIGKFHQKPGPDGSIPPFKQSAPPKAKPKTEEKTQGRTTAIEEPKSKVNANTGGSPSDLFLDVKSTNDGIQLTIRIPTMFSQPQKE